MVSRSLDCLDQHVPVGCLHPRAQGVVPNGISCPLVPANSEARPACKQGPSRLGAVGLEGGSEATSCATPKVYAERGIMEVTPSLATHIGSLEGVRVSNWLLKFGVVSPEWET